MRTVIRKKKVLEIVPISGTTLWRKIRQGTFPQPVRLGNNTVGFYEDEVNAWMESRPRGMTNTSVQE